MIFFKISMNSHEKFRTVNSTTNLSMNVFQELLLIAYLV